MKLAMVSEPRTVQCGDTLVVNPGSVGLQAFERDQPHPHHGALATGRMPPVPSTIAP